MRKKLKAIGWTSVMRSRKSSVVSITRVSIYPIVSLQGAVLTCMAVSGLDKLHAKHVLPGFTDRTAEEREIERQTQDITRVCPA